MMHVGAVRCWSMLSEDERKVGIHPTQLENMHFDFEEELSNKLLPFQFSRFLVGCRLAATADEFQRHTCKLLHADSLPPKYKKILELVLASHEIVSTGEEISSYVCLMRLKVVYRDLLKRKLTHLMHPARKAELTGCLPVDAGNTVDHLIHLRLFGALSLELKMRKALQEQYKDEKKAVEQNLLDLMDPHYVEGPSSQQRVEHLERLMHHNNEQAFLYDARRKRDRALLAVDPASIAPGDFSFLSDNLSIAEMRDLKVFPEDFRNFYEVVNRLQLWEVFDSPQPDAASLKRIDEALQEAQTYRSGLLFERSVLQMQSIRQLGWERYVAKNLEALMHGLGLLDVMAQRMLAQPLDDKTPKRFLCPLTMEVMSDPVAASDGFSYERKAIMAWLVLHDSSPITHNPMTAAELKPNDELLAEIQHWQKCQTY